MLRYRESTNDIKSATPLIFLTSGSAQSFDTTDFHEWDSIKVKTSHFHYKTGSNRIQLQTNSSGLYLIEFDCSFLNNDPAEELSVTSSIYKNGEELDDSSSEIQHASGGGETALKSQNHIHYIVYLVKGDYIQVYTESNDGEVLTSPGTCRLIISFIPMQGWDNSSGGRVDYKGGVMR